MKFREDWNKLWAKYCLFRQSWTKHLEQIKEIEWNWRGLENSDICLIAYFLTAIYKVSFVEGRIGTRLCLQTSNFYQSNIKSFRNLFRNSQTKFFKLDVKFHCPCRQIEPVLKRKVPKYYDQNIGHVWPWLGIAMRQHIQSKVALSDFTFPWWISPCKKPKLLRLSFHRYWWQKNPAI